MSRDEAITRDFVLQGFDRNSEELQIELHLGSVPIGRLRSTFAAAADSELCNAYPVDQARAAALQDLVTEKIDTEKYDFFLQRYA